MDSRPRQKSRSIVVNDRNWKISISSPQQWILEPALWFNTISSILVIIFSFRSDSYSGFWVKDEDTIVNASSLLKALPCKMWLSLSLLPFILFLINLSSCDYFCSTRIQSEVNFDPILSKKWLFLSMSNKFLFLFSKSQKGHKIQTSVLRWTVTKVTGFSVEKFSSSLRNRESDVTRWRQSRRETRR